MKVVELLLVLPSTDSGDAKSTSHVILAELTKAEVTLSKILSLVYNGASVMVGHCGGIQRLFQEQENRTIPYVHYLNHQMHLVVMHAMSVVQAIDDFLHVCGSLYNFFAIPQLHFTMMVKS